MFKTTARSLDSHPNRLSQTSSNQPQSFPWRSPWQRVVGVLLVTCLRGVHRRTARGPSPEENDPISPAWGRGMYLLTLLLSIQYRIGSQVPSEFSFPNYSLRNPPILAGFAGFEESLAHKRWGVMGREEGGGPSPSRQIIGTQEPWRGRRVGESSLPPCT